MTKLEDIEKAVEQLPPEALAQFRAWFEEFEATLFDQQLEEDAHNGKLDEMTKQSVADFKAGNVREL